MIPGYKIELYEGRKNMNGVSSCHSNRPFHLSKLGGVAHLLSSPVIPITRQVSPRVSSSKIFCANLKTLTCYGSDQFLNLYLGVNSFSGARQV